MHRVSRQHANERERQRNGSRTLHFNNLAQTTRILDRTAPDSARTPTGSLVHRRRKEWAPSCPQRRARVSWEKNIAYSSVESRELRTAGSRGYSQCVSRQSTSFRVILMGFERADRWTGSLPPSSVAYVRFRRVR